MIERDFLQPRLIFRLFYAALGKDNLGTLTGVLQLPREVFLLPPHVRLKDASMGTRPDSRLQFFTEISKLEGLCHQILLSFLQYHHVPLS